MLYIGLNHLEGFHLRFDAFNFNSFCHQSLIDLLHMFRSIIFLVSSALLSDVLETFTSLPAKFFGIFVVDGGELELFEVDVHGGGRFDNRFLFLNVQSVDGLVAVDVFVLLSPVFFDAEKLLVTLYGIQTDN